MTHDADPPFDALLEHAPFLRRLARGLVRDEARADDLVQDTWAAALRRPPRDPAGARGWLAAVARRLSLDHAKAEGRRTEREARAARDEAQPPDGELDERVELARQVLDAVQSLKEPYRGAVWLRYYDGLAPRAIARKLDVPVETVNTRLRRGKEQLRAKLDARYGERRQWLSAMTGLAALREPGLVALATGTPAIAAVLVGVPLIVAGVLFAGSGDDAAHDQLQPAAPVVVAARGERDVKTSLPPAAPDEPREREPASAETVAAAASAAQAVAAGPLVPTVLEGRVRWDERIPAGPVQVGLLRARGSRPIGELIAETSVAVGDRFEFQVPGGGDVLVVAAALGVPVITIATELPGSGRVKIETIELGDGSPFAGRLLDADLQPMPGARITARRNDLVEREPELQTYDLGRFELAFVGGAFRCVEEVAQSDDAGRFRFFGLGAGTHGFDVTSSRADVQAGTGAFHWRHEARPLVAEGPDEHLALVWRETRLQLVAVDEDGRLDGVFAACGSFAEVSAYAAGRLAPDERPSGMVLGPRGALAVRFDPADDPAVNFERPGHAPALLRLATASPDANGWVVVELPRTGATAALRITLEHDGAPVADDVLVRLHEGIKSCEEGPPLGRLERPLSPRDGVVLVDDLPPGWYSVEVQPTDGSLLLPVQGSVEVGPSSAELALELERGGLVELVPDRDALGDEPLRLRFHGDADDVVDAGWIQASDLRAGLPLRVPRAVPAGDWIVELTRDDAPRFMGEVRVVAGGVARVDL